jgi:hypothetical protein
MTSLAFIFGVYPLVIATGAGWEMRRSLGVAVLSGMIGVTLFGIFLTPVFYYALTGLRGERKPKGPPESGPLPDGEHKAPAASEAVISPEPHAAMP